MDRSVGHKFAKTKEELELGMEPDEVRNIEPLMLVLTHESIVKGHKKHLNQVYDSLEAAAWKDTQWGA